MNILKLPNEILLQLAEEVEHLDYPDWTEVVTSTDGLRSRRVCVPQKRYRSYHIAIVQNKIYYKEADFLMRSSIKLILDMTASKWMPFSTQ